MTRILIADDHDVVRSGLRAILGAQEGWVVVAEAANGQEAVERAIETKPDIAILDYSLPFANGAEVTRQLRVRLPAVEVLIFTMHESEDVVLDLLSAGAKGYLLKSDARRFLIAAVDSLAAHKPFFTGKVSEALLETYLATNRGTILSPRERAVVQLIAEGKSNKVVGDVLAISQKTVESHRATAMRKLNLDSTAALVRYAVRNKLVEA
jgi:DNA-binding NarL/FixJ family response regulator